MVEIMTKEQAFLHLKGLKIILLCLLTGFIWTFVIYKPYLGVWITTSASILIAIPFFTAWYYDKICKALYPSSYDDASAFLVFAISVIIAIFFASIIFHVDPGDLETNLEKLFHIYVNWRNS